MNFSVCIIAVGHALRAFFLGRLVNKWIFRGKIHKDRTLFSFFSFFPLGPWVGVDFFGGRGGAVEVGSGGRGIVVLPGWLPLQVNYQAILLFNGR